MVAKVFVARATDRDYVREVRFSADSPCNMMFFKFGICYWCLGNLADYAMIEMNALFRVFEELGQVDTFAFL